MPFKLYPTAHLWHYIGRGSVNTHQMSQELDGKSHILFAYRARLVGIPASGQLKKLYQGPNSLNVAPSSDGGPRSWRAPLPDSAFPDAHEPNSCHAMSLEVR